MTSEDHDTLIRIEATVAQVRDGVGRINGRVTSLEDWRAEHQLELARAAGRAAVNRRDVVIVATAATGVLSIAGVIVAAVATLMG